MRASSASTPPPGRRAGQSKNAADAPAGRVRGPALAGGSSSDEYDWASDPAGNSTFRSIATNLHAQVFTTVNYGTGTPAEAAAWVRSANQTNHCGFQYWEIGNECYGTWETDTHAVPHDPYTYATNAAAYIQQMKAAFPAVPIKVGIVVVPGEAAMSTTRIISRLIPAPAPRTTAGRP